LKVSLKKRLKIIEQTKSLRQLRKNTDRKFDVLEEIELRSSWGSKRYVYDVFSDDDWPGQQHEDAFVTFCPDPKLSIRESVYVGADHNDPMSRFTLAHELGHIHLHRRLAGRRFAREPNKKLSLRTNPREEEEANIFAGSLLVPNSYIKPHTTTWELKLRFGVSLAVAMEAIEQANFIRYKMETVA